MKRILADLKTIGIKTFLEGITVNYKTYGKVKRIASLAFGVPVSLLVVSIAAKFSSDEHRAEMSAYQVQSTLSFRLDNVNSAFRWRGLETILFGWIVDLSIPGRLELCFHAGQPVNPAVCSKFQT